MRFDELHLWRIPNGLGGLAVAELSLEEGRSRWAEHLTGPVRVVGVPETPDKVFESWLRGEAYLTSRSLSKRAA
jgi:hypothetical protein